jgi:hypothetical protein
MILTTTEGPLSALLLVFFLVSRAMCTEPASQPPRARVRALEYRGPDNNADGDPSVSVALLVELRKKPGSMLRSLEMAVGVRDGAPSLCQPADLTGVTKVNSTLWSADQEDQLRVLNFPLVISSLNVSSLSGDEKRTVPLCVSVNGEAWTQAGWIFFPPFQEEASSDSDSKSVASYSEHVASDSKHVAIDSKNVASDSKHLVSDSKHLVGDSKLVASDSKPVPSDSKNVASDSKNVASDSENSDRESEEVGSSLEVSETETTVTGMA